MKKEYMTGEQLVASFKKAFGDAVTYTDIKTRSNGATKKIPYTSVWFRFNDKALLKPVLKHMFSLQENDPHLSVISGSDRGDHVELIYHFTLFWGHKAQETSLNFGFPVLKTDLTIDSICDMVPVAIVSEREKQEMLGVKVIDIPDPRRIFICDEFPEGKYPWRKDEQGVEELVNYIHGKPEVK